MTSKPDSLIFDMDGTLWDAADTYAASWTEGMKREGIDKVFTRDDLSHLMGWERAKVLEYMFPEKTVYERERVFAIVNECRAELLSTMGGRVYEGVREGLELLASKYKLFIVSNCPVGVIVQFMKWANVEAFITDEMAHGVNSMPKHHNIKLLIDKYELDNPVYIGDTDIDSQESRISGLPFVFVNYGFGDTEDYDLEFSDFKSFTDHFMRLT
jgi:phosphoglycolate phosphatase